LPASDGADALSSPRDVTHARKKPTQLHDGGELAPLLERGADDGSLRFGQDEHRESMAMWVVDDKTSPFGSAAPRVAVFVLVTTGDRLLVADRLADFVFGTRAITIGS
jgi:hypothetical protein